MPASPARHLVLACVLALGTAGCATRPSDLPPLTETQIRDATGYPTRALGQRPDAALPAGVSLNDGVTEDEASAVALWNNAQLSADLATLGLAEAGIVEAGQLRNPSLQILFPLGPKPFELSLLFALEQLWQRPSRMAAARRQWEQVAQALVQNGLDTARHARQVHANLLQAQERAVAGRELQQIRRRLADMARARLEAGDISALDVRLAEADAAAADEQATRFEHDLVVAHERLRVMLGLLPGQKLEAVPAPVDRTQPAGADVLRERAWGLRPDLRAVELSVAAAAARAKWERSRWVALGALLSSKEVGSSGVRTGPGLSADIPVFKSNAGPVSRADAEVEQAARLYLARRQQVDLEVTEAREALAQALDSLADWHDRVLPGLAGAVDKARQAFEAGDVSYLAVLEISRQWMDATLRDIDLQAAARRAAAELDRSVGGRITGGNGS